MPRGIPNKPTTEEVNPEQEVNGIPLDTITDLVFIAQNGERVHLDYFRGGDTFILRPL